MVSTDDIMLALEAVIDPELGVDIVNLGLVYNVTADPSSGAVHVEMTLTSPGCPLGPVIAGSARRVLLGLDGVREAQVEIVWNPPWSPTRLTARARRKLGLG